jgi:hypothetical protein
MPGAFLTLGVRVHARELAPLPAARQPAVPWRRTRVSAARSPATIAGALSLAGCALFEPEARPVAPPDTVASVQATAAPEPPRRLVDLDSLSTALLARADTSDLAGRAALETEIRDWLARLEFGDPDLLPEGADPRVHLRPWRGRLLDALGWLAFRARDWRQAEAALVSAEEQIHNRGTTEGYALHFWHLGKLHAARGRWRQAADAFLDAEVRGMGAAASPDLAAAWSRSRGSLRGLDQARAGELARVEDERRQSLVAGSLWQALPAFTWPRRTGPPMSVSDLAGRRAVIAVWGPGCEGCEGFSAALEPLAARLAERRATLVAVWLGGDPAMAGPPQRYTVLTPDSAEAARRLAVDSLPLLAIVDGRGLIRYRHSGRQAVPPPIEDILVQIDFLGFGR